jgi:hypothetical protein
MANLHKKQPSDKDSFLDRQDAVFYGLANIPLPAKQSKIAFVDLKIRLASVAGIMSGVPQ